MQDRFIVGLGWGILACWAISVLAEIVSNAVGGTYTTPLAVHAMMGTIVGAVFTEQRMRKATRRNPPRRRTGDSKDKK